MKLVTYDSEGTTKAGVLVSDLIFSAAEVLNTQHRFRDVAALLELSENVVDRLRDGLGNINKYRGLPLDKTRLRAPILRPPTIRDFFTYEAHASMGGQWKLHEAWYRLPVFYFSNPLCIYGPDEEVPYPSTTKKFDYELELAAVIGREGRNVASDDAWSYLAGFTIMNDWSCRDLQRDEMQTGIGAAKGKDSATSLGPYLVTTDELLPFVRDGRLDLSCKLKVNDVEWATSETGSMHHDWASMVERASRDSRIVAGDVIGAGTVAGGSIGEAIRLGKPARYLSPGDTIEITIEAIGQLRTRISPSSVHVGGYRFMPPTRHTAG